MKHLILILFLAIAADAFGQGITFGPPARVRKGTGAPSSGECVASSDVGKVYVQANTADTSYPLSVCANTGAGTFGWVQASGGGGSGDITAVVAGTGLTGGATSGSATLSIDSTVVTLSGTQTLTNKSISAGQINSGTLALARGGTNQGTWTASRCVQVSSDGTALESAASACGSGGSGATATFGLTDLQVVRTSDTRITIGGSCSVSAPCNVRFGNTVYSFTGSATADLNGISGTGTVLFYVLPSGQLTVGYNSAPVPSCSAGCTPVSGVTAFPADSIPLASWTATSGDWDITSAAFDKRAMLAAKPLAAGSGISISESGGVATIAATGGGGGGYALKYGHAALSAISTSTTFYIGNPINNFSWMASADPWYIEGAKIAVPKAGSIKKISWDLGITGSGSFSSQSVALSVCVVNAANGSVSGESCTSLTPAMTWDGVAIRGKHGVFTVNIAVAEGDRLLMKMVTPAWSTTAEVISFQGYIYIE